MKSAIEKSSVQDWKKCDEFFISKQLSIMNLFLLNSQPSIPSWNFRMLRAVHMSK
jgi:hypothetical protein